MKLTTRGKVAAGLAIVFALALAGLGAGYLYLRSLGVYGPSDPGPRIRLEIPQGATAAEVGRLLEKAGVIPSARGFRIKLFVDGSRGCCQAGRYEIRQGLNAADALEALLEGPVVEFVTVTFPEGLWLTDFARIIERDTHISGGTFLDLVANAKIRSEYLPPNVDTLEGLLFPSTYQVIEEDTAQTLATRLVREFEKQAEPLDLSRAEAWELTPYEAVIVASMVEAEAKIDDERPMVARVIYNRLDRGMPLGIDATVNYAIKDHKLELTRSELAVDSPYNTRIHTGLPPTPIGAPGLAALEAAVEPAEGDWLYYVLADCDGRHAFSESYREFVANKAAYEALDC